MKNKQLFAWIALVICLAGWFFLVMNRKGNPSVSSGDLLSTKEFATAPKAPPIDSMAEKDVSGPTPGDGGQDQEKATAMEEMGASIALLHERWTKGKILEDAPQKGMANAVDVLKSAIARLGMSSSLNVMASRIFLVGDSYIVCVPRYQNPFYFYPDNLWDFGLWLGYEAWSGKFIATQHPADGGQMAYMLGSKTGGDGNESSIASYQNRFLASLEKLHNRICYGQVSESERNEGMIESVEAIKIASTQIEDRTYDQSKKPLPLLVDDVYVVVFWKRSEEINSTGDFLYTARVGIDAYTGEFIAMEIPRKRRHLENKSEDE
jgi:hypothetical protein